MALNPYSTNPSRRDTIDPNNVATDKNPNRASRIWNVFKPTIVLDEISLPQSGEPGNTNKTEDYASMEYPIVKINDYFFSPNELQSVTIDSRGFLPTISVTVVMGNKYFISKEMPKDGDIISIMIRNKNDILVPIRNDYVITGVPTRAIYPNDKVPVSLTFFGELFVPGLKSYLGSLAFTGTTMEVMKEVATRMDLGFNTNENETDDKQTWIIAGDTITFMQDLAYKSWKNENSFFDVWIDVYYNVNYVNQQKILLAAEDEIDPAAFLGNIDVEFTWGAATDEENAIDIPKVFSNFDGYRTSSNYVTSWKPINKSSAITFEYGTSMNASFYEHLDILYSDPNSQKYWNLEVSPDYDPQKVDNHILLRGRVAYDPSTANGEQARANYSYKDIYKRSPWLGIQYTISDPDDAPDKWTGNHHRNYMRAQVHNLVNTIELDKLNLEVKVRGVNTNVIKGDKVPLVLVKGDMHEAQIANKDLNPQEAVDFFYTGWYLIKGFSLSWNKNNSFFSSFSQTFVLTRREWTPPSPVATLQRTEDRNNQNIRPIS